MRPISKKVRGGFRRTSTVTLSSSKKTEAKLFEIKATLVATLKRIRQKRGISQIDLARRLGSSQSRIAKVEAADPSVSLDLIVRAFLATGVTHEELGRILGSSGTT
jgi:ribosome-binding protein aMBF1 (putative translation factor)